MATGQSVILKDTIYPNDPMSYCYDSTLKNVDRSILTCESQNEIVDLGFEKFTCVKFHLTRIYGTLPYEYNYSFWYALNKGKIKHEASYGNSLFYRETLTGYHVN